MTRAVPLAAALAALAVFFVAAGAPRYAPDGRAPLPWPTGAPRVIDFHTHLDPRALDAALGLFDHEGVGMAVNLAGLPAAAIDLCLAMQRRSAGRVVCFAGVDWRRFVATGDGVAAADDLQRAVARGARGLKIPKALGLAIPDPADPERLLAVDDARLAPVWERAADLGVPVSIHVGDPVAFWRPLDPSNERWDELKLNPDWSYADRDVPSHAALFAAQRRLFLRHPRTSFVGVHVAGFPEDLDAVSRLLDEAPNVFVDVAARIPELGRHPVERQRAFFARHQDRILFGTDLGLAPGNVMLGAPLAWQETEEDVARFYGATWRWLRTDDVGFEHPTPIQGRWRISGVALPPAILDKVLYANAARLLRIVDEPAR